MVSSCGWPNVEMDRRRKRRKIRNWKPWDLYATSLAILVLLINSSTMAQGPVLDVQSVAHKKAVLPCDISPSVSSDSTILVLWYKDFGDMPIYSYDARTQPGSHTKNEILLTKRAYFRTVTEPASLSIDNVGESDAGLYRCRVDFLKSPTRNTKVNLTIVVPPQKPTIFDGTGRDIGDVAGPFTEDSTMSLTCVASGGRPPPKVTWWRGGTLLDDSYKLINFEGAVQNKLEVLGLTRSDLHSVFTCQASNNNMSDPVTTSVQVEMYFRPLQASILGSNQPLSALHEIEIVCQSIGSRPPANITWFKDGHYVESSRQEESGTGNVSTSVLRLIPRVGDHGKLLTCRAQNPRLDASAVEDSWKLTVFFLPILHLAFGSSLNPDNIREDTDVYFECKIHSNPWVYKVVWLHNGVPVQHNATAGIILTNQSLVLQKLKRSSAGTYICKASNIEGEGSSNAVVLNLMHKPVCKPDQKRMYGVAKGEQVEIECKVDSNPKADNFKWAFNNSAESIDVAQARYSIGNSAKLTSTSILRYTPYNELDYGSVICYASNEVGHQSTPCVFHIVAAEKPDSTDNCTVQNKSLDSLKIGCLAASVNGGLQQVFHSEVVDAGSQRVGVAAASQRPFELTPILGVGIGILCGIAVVIIGILLALKVRQNGKRPNNLSLKTTKTEYRVEVGDEDRNPDIIPSSSDPEYYYMEDGLDNGPKRNGSLTDKFRNCTYYSDTSNAEITYTDPYGDSTSNTGWSSGSGGLKESKRRKSPDDEYPPPPVRAVVYATINQNQNFESRSRPNDEVHPGHPHSHPHHYLPPHQREIVSVRTPLLVNPQQESCV